MLNEEDKASAFDKDVDMIEQLIEEHFEPKENTEEYKHFKLHSDSSLKNLTKVELIDYIKMLYHNWGISNDELRRHLYFIEPYNFEDLKVGMWILDRKPQYEEYTFIKIKIRKYFLIIWNVLPENLKKTVSSQCNMLI